MLNINLSDYNKISNDYKGIYQDYQGTNPELKGKKTILKGCLIPGGGTSLMLDGIHFTIENDK